MKERKTPVLVACMVCISSLAWGQDSRTWVSGWGDDASPCSRTAPCLTLAAALLKTAPGGEIDALDPGDFGPVTITQSITIDGHGANTNLLAKTGGIVVRAGASDFVILRHLSFQGGTPPGNGITFSSGQSLSVENSIISGFSAHGIDFESATGGMLFLKEVLLASNGSAGVYVRSGGRAQASATIVKTRSVGNSVGFKAGGNGRISLYDSIASENTDAGLLVSVADTTADTTAGEINAEEMALTENGVGARAETASGTAVIRLSKSLVTGNRSAPTALGGLGRIVSYGNNRIVGGSISACLPGTLTLSPPTLPETTSGAALPNVTFVTTGAMGGVSFTETGTLPEGITFSQDTLAGAPTQSGTFPITVAATDGFNCTTSVQYQVVVTPGKAGKGCGCGTETGPLGFSALFLGFLWIQRWLRARRREPSM